MERLRFAKFDACVVEKFFAGRYDAKAYRRSVGELIRMSNEAVLETMSLAATFVADHEAPEIFQHWAILEQLRNEQKLLDQKISGALDRLMIDNGFEVSLGHGEAEARTWPPRAIARPDVAIPSAT